MHYGENPKEAGIGTVLIELHLFYSNGHVEGKDYVFYAIEL